MNRIKITKEQLSGNLKKFRMENGFTQDFMAHYVLKNKITLRTYIDWENGKRLPRSNAYLSLLKNRSLI